MVIHSVKAGDSLWLISSTYNVTPESIISANGIMRPESLVVGMNLLIPAPSPSDIHVVMPGDTLYSIAAKYGLSLSQLITANNLVYPYSIYAGQQIKIKSVIETIGYFIPSRVQDRTAFLNSMARFFTYLAIFDFPVTETGDITGIPDTEIMAAARNNGLMVMPVLTNLMNGEFSSSTGHILVSDFNVRNNLINNIITFLLEHDFSGVVIDFENLPPEDRDLFTLFIHDLYTSLHRFGKILVLNIAPKWEDWFDREWVGFFDYVRLGPVIDIAAIMTYEWGWRSGPPRPTAPLPYIRKVLDYALNNNIPADKICLGLTLYGYDWILPYQEGNLARTVTLPEVWDLARRYNSDILFDDEAKQPSLMYVNDNGVQHETWFEDALSHYYKYGILKKYGLGGAFYWLVDQPFPATWYMASELFAIRK